MVESAGGREPVVVGASRGGTDTTISAHHQAEALVAAAVMTAPPDFATARPEMTKHFRAIGTSPPPTSDVPRRVPLIAGLVLDRPGDRPG